MVCGCGPRSCSVSPASSPCACRCAGRHSESFPCRRRNRTDRRSRPRARSAALARRAARVHRAGRGDRRRRHQRAGSAVDRRGARGSDAGRATPASRRPRDQGAYARHRNRGRSRASPSLASAIASYELKAFAFVPKPFDVDQLFGDRRARASSIAGSMLANRRLVWEQRLVNEIGDELRHLLASEQLVGRALQRLMQASKSTQRRARLLNPRPASRGRRGRRASPTVRRCGRRPARRAAPERSRPRDPRAGAHRRSPRRSSTPTIAGAPAGAQRAERADVRRRRI